MMFLKSRILFILNKINLLLVKNNEKQIRKLTIVRIVIAGISCEKV